MSEGFSPIQIHCGKKLQNRCLGISTSHFIFLSSFDKKKNVQIFFCHETKRKRRKMNVEGIFRRSLYRFSHCRCCYHVTLSRAFNRHLISLACCCQKKTLFLVNIYEKKLFFSFSLKGAFLSFMQSSFLCCASTILLCCAMCISWLHSVKR